MVARYSCATFRRNSAAPGGGLLSRTSGTGHGPRRGQDARRERSCAPALARAMQSQTTQTLSRGEPSDPRPPGQGEAWPMHARSVGQLLDLAVDLFVQRFAATVGLTFLMWLPVRLLWVLLQESESSDLTLFHSFATFTVQALAVALAIQVIYSELQGRRIGMRQPLMGALRRAPALLVMTGI